jgi:ferredoxin/flavodoxin
MRNIKKANIVYFSGTGGTALAANGIKENLEAKGIEVIIKELAVYDQTVIKPQDILFLLYPVYAADAVKAVYEFIDIMPSGNPLLDAVVLSISAGGETLSNTACRAKVIKRLLKRGYATVYEDMIVMPNNFASAFSDKLSGMIMHALPIKLKQITDDIMSGIIKRTEPKKIDYVLRGAMSPFKPGSSLMGRMMRATESCTSCGLCAERCPRGNIRMVENKPKFGGNCVACMRCIYACPIGAIKGGLAGSVKVKGGFDIDKLKALGETAVLDQKEIIAETEGAMNAGVRAYLLSCIKNNI